MKMKKLIVFLLAAVSFIAMVSVASAANWKRVYSDTDYIIHVDTSSIKRHGDSFEVMERCYYNSYQSIAAMGIIAAFSPATIGQSSADVAYDISIVEYKKNSSQCRRLDGAMFNKRNRMVCPLSTSDWKECTKKDEAVRRAVKAMKSWR